MWALEKNIRDWNTVYTGYQFLQLADAQGKVVTGFLVIRVD